MALEDSIIALANAITQQTELLRQMASAPIRAAAGTPAGSLAEDSSAPAKGKGKAATKNAAKTEAKDEPEQSEDPAPTADDVNAVLATLIGTKAPKGKEVAKGVINKFSPETGKLGGVDPAKYGEFIEAVKEATLALNAQEDAPAEAADPLGDL